MSTQAMQQPQDMGMVQKESSNMGMAFIMGAALGAISGLLFAPKSGQQTRDDIKHRTDDMNATAHDRIDQVKEKAHSIADKMKNKTDRAIDSTDMIQEKNEEVMDRMESRGKRQI